MNIVVIAPKKQPTLYAATEIPAPTVNPRPCMGLGSEEARLESSIYDSFGSSSSLTSFPSRW